MSDTPRTDAMMHPRGGNTGGLVELCRQLERELAQRERRISACLAACDGMTTDFLERCAGSFRKEDFSELDALRDRVAELESITQSETTDTASVARSESMHRWIPVSERLPNPHSDAEYIIATRSGLVVGMHFGEHGWYSDGSTEESAHDGYWNGCITFWQPMPAAPETEKATTL
jgi:hypothetical protein